MNKLTKKNDMPKQFKHWVLCHIGNSSDIFLDFSRYIKHKFVIYRTYNKDEIRVDYYPTNMKDFKDLIECARIMWHLIDLDDYDLWEFYENYSDPFGYDEYGETFYFRWDRDAVSKIKEYHAHLKSTGVDINKKH